MPTFHYCSRGTGLLLTRTFVCTTSRTLDWTLGSDGLLTPSMEANAYGSIAGATCPCGVQHVLYSGFLTNICSLHIAMVPTRTSSSSLGTNTDPLAARLACTNLARISLEGHFRGFYVNFQGQVGRIVFFLFLLPLLFQSCYFLFCVFTRPRPKTTFASVQICANRSTQGFSVPFNVNLP